MIHPAGWHVLLREPEHARVEANILAWLDARCPQQLGSRPPGAAADAAAVVASAGAGAAAGVADGTRV